MATSSSSAAISPNRLTATSIAGIRSVIENGFTRYAIAPASRARSTSSRWEKAVRIDDRRDALRRDLGGRVDAVAARHLDVHDHQVGSQALGEFDRLLAVAGLADDLVALLAQHLGEIHADERLVLGDEHAARLWRRPSVTRSWRTLSREQPQISDRGAVTGAAGRSSMVGNRTANALVSQLAEETDSKPVQCEFESHRGHQKDQLKGYKPSSVGFGSSISPQSARRNSYAGMSMTRRGARAGVEDRWAPASPRG